MNIANSGIVEMEQAPSALVRGTPCRQLKNLPISKKSLEEESNCKTGTGIQTIRMRY